MGKGYIRLAVDGMYYCPDCREACDVRVADAEQQLISAAQVLHPGAGQHGEDVAAPTTFLIDKQGLVRALFRPRQVLSRLSASEVLTAVDTELSGAR